MDLCRFGGGGGGVQSSDDDYLMNGTIDGNPPPGHDALLFSISGTGCLVAQTRLDIPRPLFTQSWTTGRKVKVLRHKADSNR